MSDPVADSKLELMQLACTCQHQPIQANWDILLWSICSQQLFTLHERATAAPSHPHPRPESPHVQLTLLLLATNNHLMNSRGMKAQIAA
jgi:hypothetical protein